jgi:hypothetical protein
MYTSEYMMAHSAALYAQPEICSERISGVQIDQIGLLGQMSRHAVCLNDLLSANVGESRRRKQRLVVMAGLGNDPDQVYRTLRELDWEVLRLWTGFELSSSWNVLPCYGTNLNRNILDLMRWPQNDLRAQDLNDIQRPKSFQTLEESSGPAKIARRSYHTKCTKKCGLRTNCNAVLKELGPKTLNRIVAQSSHKQWQGGGRRGGEQGGSDSR